MTDSDKYHSLLALALDLLAQSEARQRAAARLERATALLVRTAVAVNACDVVQLRQVQEHLRLLREFRRNEKPLLDDFERALSHLSSRIPNP